MGNQPINNQNNNDLVRVINQLAQEINHMGVINNNNNNDLTAALNQLTQGMNENMGDNVVNNARRNRQQRNMGTPNIVNGVFGTAFNVVNSVIRFFTTQPFQQFMQMQKITGQLAADIGLSRSESKGLLNNFTQLTTTAMEFGGEMSDISDIISSLSEITGKNKLIDEEDVKNIERLGRGTALGVRGLSDMVANFNNLGISMNKTFKLVDKARDGASKLGLNVGKVLTSYQSLVTGLTGFQMKSGLDNMIKLATQATQLRMDLSNVAETMSSAFFEPEGAVEAAAKMQVLGGQFAEKFGDAFQLMYKAQVSPEMFQKDLMDMVKGLAVKGENGIFYVPPQQMRMLQEVAKTLGVQYKDLRDGAIEQGKLADKLSAMSGQGLLFKNDEERQAAANLIDFDSESGSYMVRLMDGKKQLLKQTTESELLNIIKQKKTDDEAAKKRMNFLERMSNMFNRVTTSFSQAFAEIFDKLEESGIMKTLEDTMTELTKKIIPLMKDIFSNNGEIGKFITTLFKTIEEVITKVYDILKDPNKTLWQSIKDGMKELLIGIWQEIMPVIAYGFGGLLKALQNLPLVGNALKQTGMEMQLQAAGENKNVRSLIGGDEGVKKLSDEVNKGEASGGFIKNSLGFVWRGIEGITNGLVGVTEKLVGATDASKKDLAYAALRFRQSGNDFLDIIDSTNDDQEAMYKSLKEEGLSTASGRGYKMSRGQEIPVNDAILSNGRIYKGAKGDIPALFDEATVRNRSNNGGVNEIKHSGEITVKSADGKQITISDLDKIGRYTLAQYMDSLNHGMKNGTAVYNNEKMPIAPIA